MEPKARKNFLKEKGFCFLCLKSSHVSLNCPEKKESVTIIHLRTFAIARFLWFDNVFSDQPKIIRNSFGPVIFSVTCSSLLLNKVIRKHAKEYEFDIDIVNKFFYCFYTDDFTANEKNFYKALDLFKKLKLRFLDIHFHLCKSRTNDPKLRKIILENTFNSLEPEKTLGILWEEVDNMLVSAWTNFLLGGRLFG